MTASKNDLLAEWEVLCPIGPCLAYHVGACIGNCLYVHGGLLNRQQTETSNKLHYLNLETMIWNEIRVPGSPALSHHACVTINNRYLLLIGGWDGKNRTSKLYAFDTVDKKWLYPVTNGFPSDAGLSSHTATLLNNGKILVLGREGPLRMQPDDKIHGNAYMLTGTVESGKFHYSEYSRATESRSGHTTNFIGKTLYILGGRNDQLLEVHSGYRSGTPDSEKFSDSLKRLIPRLKPMDKLPCGRRHHVALESSGAILIHGGETFDGRSKMGKPVGDMYIMTNKPNINFYKIGESKVGRAGHVCCMTENDEVLMHGGYSNTTVHGDTRMLEFKV